MIYAGNINARTQIFVPPSPSFGLILYVQKASSAPEILDTIRIIILLIKPMDYGRPVMKLPSLHGQKSNPNPKSLGTAETYFVCRSGLNFQISSIYAFTECPQSVVTRSQEFMQILQQYESHTNLTNWLSQFKVPELQLAERDQLRGENRPKQIIIAIVNWLVLISHRLELLE